MITALLALGFSLSGTLMYFTSVSPESTNVITLGGLNITLTESNEDDTVVIEEDGDGLVYDHIPPGQSIKKEPRVSTEEEDINSYIRVCFDMEWPGVEDDDELALLNEISAEILNGIAASSSSNWHFVSGGAANGFFYYVVDKEASPIVLSALPGGGSTDSIFESVSIPTNLPNLAQNKTINIHLRAEAVQSDGNTAPDGESFDLSDYFTSLSPSA
jgi:hypothetical protein